MTKVTSIRDVYQTGKIPHTQEEWLRFDNVEQTFAQIDGLRIQCGVFTPPEAGNAATGTFYIGGVPAEPNRRSTLPVINRLFGFAAAGSAVAAEAPSYGISFNWPGLGGSEGEIMATTISSRTRFLLELIDTFTHRYSLDRINLVGMSMGSYVGLMAIATLDPKRLNSVTLMSPAAYPVEVHDLPYGQQLSDVIRSSWDFSSSPSMTVARQLGTRCLLAYFEHDDPPIPMGIQVAYHDAATDNRLVRCHTIEGVGHNFRRPGAVHDARNVIDSEAVRVFGRTLVDFLGE